MGKRQARQALDERNLASQHKGLESEKQTLPKGEEFTSLSSKEEGRDWAADQVRNSVESGPML